MALRKWEVALRLARRAVQRWPEVWGLDYGRVYKDGHPLKMLGVRFHLARKRAPETLLPSELLPREMAGIRCDVVEARYSLQAGPKGVCDPLQPGVSVGNVVRGKTGTLGLPVRDRQTGATGLVSNWHVFCGSPEAQRGEAIGQPGPDHQPIPPARAIGTLERWAPLDTGCDAALALLTAGFSVTGTLFEHTLAVSGIAAPREGMKVVKYGASTRLTAGRIDGIEGAYEMDYGPYGDTKRWIDGIRIVVDPMDPRDEISLTGDSGALWVEADSGKAVALHFAGEDGLGPTAEYALAQPIERVLDLLDADMI